MLKEPITDHSDRNTERRDGERAEGGKDRKARPAESRRRAHSSRADADARVPRIAAHSEFRKQQRKTQRDENEREQRGLGAGEPSAVLGVELGGEGPEAQQSEGAELGQRVEGDEQRAAEEGRAKLGKDDPQETSPGALAERARCLFERGIESAQRRGDRQVHQRIIGAGHDEQSAGEVLERIAHRNPGIAGDEGRDGEGRRKESGPHVSPGKIHAFDQPGRRGSYNRCRERRCNDERDRIEKEPADERTKQQAGGVAEIDGDRFSDGVEDRQKDERRAHERSSDERSGRARDNGANSGRFDARLACARNRQPSDDARLA